MTRTIKLAVAAAMALGATSAFATNGDTLLGLGAKSRGMGGIGIGMSFGAESALSNPALITSVKGTEVSFGGTIFMPHVKTDLGYGSASSKADMNMIPEVSLASKVNDNFYWGIGMWGTAGMGVDYRNATTLGGVNMVTNLQLMQFGVPLAYKNSGVSVGITPILQYGSLDINYDATNMPGSTTSQVGAGVAQDFGFGYTIGAAYDFSAVGVDGLTVGAVYKSEIEMKYDGQLSAATTPFAPIFGGPMSDTLTQPAEFGAGVSYAFGGSTIAFDYKQIQWKEAKGYKEFGWDNQDVFKIGYQFAMDNWAARVGYNYGKNPVKEQDGTTPAGAALNFFNLMGFPATVESHYTIGGTYDFSEQTSVDLAYTYAAEVSDTYGIQGLGFNTIKTTHSQDGVSLQLNYKF